MNITEEQRKLLTEWLGECWHEWHFAPEDVTPCLKCRSRKDNRTFDNWNDFGAVVEKLGWGYITYFTPKMPYVGITTKEYPERFCILVAEAIKEGVTK